MSLIIWLVLRIIEYRKEQELQFWLSEGFSSVPIFKKKGKWYFWDETWTDFYGPFESKEECKKALKSYIFILDMKTRKRIAEASKGDKWADIEKAIIDHIKSTFKGEYYL